MIINQINTLINKIIDRNSYRNISFTFLLRKKIHNFIIEKILEDKPIHFSNIKDYWKFCYNFPAQENRLNLEFGVGAGTSGNILAETLPNEKIYGFDSFKGFYKISKSSLWFKVNKTFKKVKPKMKSNYEIIEGFVENTLDNFEKKININDYEAIFVHADLDIYEPTKHVLKKILKYNKKTYIMFDQFLNYEEFEQHEWKAFYEEVIRKDIKYKIIAFTDQSNDDWGNFTKVFIEIF